MWEEGGGGTKRFNNRPARTRTMSKCGHDANAAKLTASQEYIPGKLSSRTDGNRTMQEVECQRHLEGGGKDLTRTIEQVKTDVATTRMQQKLAASQERTAGVLPARADVIGTSMLRGAASRRLQRMVLRVPMALSRGGNAQKEKAIITGPAAVRGMARLLGASLRPPRSMAAEANSGTSSSIML